MTTLLFVCLGAAIGGGCRHLVNVISAKMLFVDFPLGTLTVNILGSFLIGLLVGYFAFKGEVSQHWRLFLVTGILGGFTTFSAFSLEVATMIEQRALGMALTYAVLSVVVCVAAVFLGSLVFRSGV